MHNIITQTVGLRELPQGAKIIDRVAVRGICLREDLYLSNIGIHDYYSFPGGGVEEGETLHEALRREILEECGYTVTFIGDEIAVIIEQKQLAHDEFYRCENHFFLCEVTPEPTAPPQAEVVKDQLRMHPVWVTPNEAVSNNARQEYDAVSRDRTIWRLLDKK